MRPVGVVKIEALDGILAIILWVSDSCGCSLHLDDAVRLFVHLPTVEGPAPHRHFYARHLGRYLFLCAAAGMDGV